MSLSGHRLVGVTECFVRLQPPSLILFTEFQGRGTCVMEEPACVAGTMESPFSLGLSHKPDEDWGEWDLINVLGWLGFASKGFFLPASAHYR